jgi:hypothetical protein
MKMITNFCLMAAAGLMAGCAGEKNGMVLDPVGPVPAQSAGANGAPGTLLVYSAYQATADFNARNPNLPECSDYKILTADGKLLKRVHNVTDNVQQAPVPVSLPSGNYEVVARANGHGTVTVPVQVAAGQNTVLHLEGGYHWRDQAGETNMVCLPGGEIVGWKGTVAR